jgi:hypothetical protein
MVQTRVRCITDYTVETHDLLQIVRPRMRFVYLYRRWDAILAFCLHRKTVPLASVLVAHSPLFFRLHGEPARV